MRRAAIPSSHSPLGPAIGLVALLASVLAACAADVTLPEQAAQVQAGQPAAADAPPAPGTLPPPPPLGGAVPPPRIDPDGPVRVALLLPLTGSHAQIGRDMIDAAQLALFDLADERFVLMPRDTGGTPDGAARAARGALREGASLIVGPLLASSVEGVAEQARAVGVRVISFSTDRNVAGNGVFVMGFLPETQILRVVSFARTQGLSRFAILAPATPYGQTVMRALEGATTLNNAELTGVTYYPATGDATEIVREFALYDERRRAMEAQRAQLIGNEDEISQQALTLLKLRETVGELPYDAVLLPDGGPRLLAISPLLPYYDIDPAEVRLLGTGQWDDPAVRLEPALRGGWFAAPLPEARARFEERFDAAYGRTPVRLATLAYDGTALAAVLARAEGGPDFSIQALASPNGYAGQDGIFRFRQDGVVERGLAVLEVRRDGFLVVDPPPSSFQPATN